MTTFALSRVPPFRRVWLVLTGLGVTTAVVAFASLFVGAGFVKAADVWRYLAGDASARADAQLAMVIQHLRMPRLVVALLVGPALGVAGLMLQAATRNPLAEPGLLGINAGAALMVVVGITWFHAQTGWSYLIWSAAGAMAANGLILLTLRWLAGSSDPAQLVIAGVAFGAIFYGMTAYILFTHQLSFDQYRFWVMGSLSGVQFKQVGPALIPILTALALAALGHRAFTALQMGDDLARSLGHSPERIRPVCALLVTLLAGSSVALVGPVGFLGLMAPHMARAVAPRSFVWQLVFAALIGALMMIVADCLARWMSRPFETPASVVVALVGAPFMIALVRSRQLNRLGEQP